MRTALTIIAGLGLIAAGFVVAGTYGWWEGEVVGCVLAGTGTLAILLGPVTEFLTGRMERR